jgi:molecular chaperone DnaK (HSP70)
LNFALSRGIHKSDIQQVLLVGGSCLIPAVQQIVLSYFGKQKVALHKPFEAVCHGALYLSKLEAIEDYLRHSYVIRLWQPASQSYTYYPLFEAGLKYPCQRTEALSLGVANPNQREIRLDIGELAKLTEAEVFYDEQGRLTSSELHVQSNFRSLEANRQQVCLPLEPLGQLGNDRLAVNFEVNENRVLLATVYDLLTDKILADKTAIAKLE